MFFDDRVATFGWYDISNGSLGYNADTNKNWPCQYISRIMRVGQYLQYFVPIFVGWANVDVTHPLGLKHLH